MQTVYIETTIPSYLAARRSRQPLMAAQQQSTHDWWNHQRHHFLLYCSNFVMEEASAGDPDAARRRLSYLTEIPQLEVPLGFERLEAEIIRLFQLPDRAAVDASHLTMAILHRMDYMLTWNCTHLANASLQKDLHQYCQYHRLHYPVICTPDNLKLQLP